MAEKNQSPNTCARNILLPHRMKEILTLASDIYKRATGNSENWDSLKKIWLETEEKIKEEKGVEISRWERMETHEEIATIQIRIKASVLTLLIPQKTWVLSTQNRNENNDINNTYRHILYYLIYVTIAPWDGYLCAHFWDEYTKVSSYELDLATWIPRFLPRSLNLEGRMQRWKDTERLSLEMMVVERVKNLVVL